MWGKSRLLWVQLFFALITLGALGALSCNAPGEGAELGAPRQAPVGDPFLVTLSSDLPMTDLVLRWGGGAAPWTSSPGEEGGSPGPSWGQRPTPPRPGR